MKSTLESPPTDVGARGARPGRGSTPAILVTRARTHNLKGIDCRVPHRAVTVVTGPSGAGKSSLAFDTLFAEGQRRFVESMSTYARQFLNQMERPPVEAIDNILPAVALEAKNAVRNARSTVGTITETLDVLRLLYTHLGVAGCPNGHGPVRSLSPEDAAQLLARGEAGDPFLLVALLPRPKKGAKAALGELIRQGFQRRLAGSEPGAEVLRLEPGADWPARLDPLPLVLGRFAAKEEALPRILDTVEQGYKMTGGRLEARSAAPGDAGGERRVLLSRELSCPVCGAVVRRPNPALFSFNSPLGACPTCQGFGRAIGIDRERVVPDPRKSLAERPIAPWNTPAYEELYDELYRAARKRKIPLDVPWGELYGEAREWIWNGKGNPATIEGFFRYLEGKTYKVHVRVLLARYRSYVLCPDCGGARLRPEALAFRLEGKTLPELAALSVEGFRAWLAGRDWTPRQREVSGHLLDELTERIEVLHRVGLDYLTLDRQARTLSGGETQRIHLAAALGSGLTSTLYVLDEPTIGLHPQDSERLLSLLRDLAARGNTVLVVEHDRTLIRGADHVIDLGPLAGEHGGEVVAEGPIEAILASPDSLTGRYLRERPATQARSDRREHGRGKGTAGEQSRWRFLRIRGARAHNLKDIDVELPLGAFVAVTGVSGSGKSTLVENVLYGTYQRSKGVVDTDPGEVDALEGLEELADMTLVDQRPIGRSSRSNPITYIKAYDEIRRIYAETPEARRNGITAGHFSFNVDRGRCPACEGTGITEVDMQFMAPVTVVCEICQGHRFKPEVLAARYRGRNIAEALDLTVDAALDFFAGEKRLLRRLQLLIEVGLGYLRLGQSTSTLSGGEAQRLKLASFLDKPEREGARLFLFDEPTTGLHLADIDLLHQTLRRLVQAGHGVVAVEHSPDLIAHADWIVDLGPGGGVNGGELLFSGPLEAFLDEAHGPTATELRKHLRWGEQAGSSIST